MSLDVAPEGLLPAGGLDDHVVIAGKSTLAWDVVGEYGAVFSMWLSKQGEYNLEAQLLRREAPGRWFDLGGGGSHGGGWDVPFPPASGWPFEGLAVMGTQGLDVDGPDGSDVALDAVYGFLAPPASCVLVKRDGQSRIVRPAAATRAFVALTLGARAAWLTPLAGDGRPVGEEASCGHQPGPPPHRRWPLHSWRLRFGFGH